MKNRGKVPTLTDLRELARRFNESSRIVVDIYGGLHCEWGTSDWAFDSIAFSRNTKQTRRALAAALRELGKDIK